MKNLIAKISIATMLIALSGFASASFIALDSTRTSGNQNYTQSLSMYFDVLEAITVTDLGVFDSNQDGLQRSIQVGIYNRATGVFVTPIETLFGDQDPLDGNSRFVDIVDVVLQAGEYAIVARGYGSGESNGNSSGSSVNAPTINTGNGLIEFTGRSYFGGSGITDVALRTDTGPVNRYDAGTFKFSPVVEASAPSVLSLMGLMIVAMFVRRKLAS